MAKLVAGRMPAPATLNHREQDVLKAAVAFLRANPIVFDPKMDHRMQLNPDVNLDAWPNNAKRLRSK